MKQIAYIFFTSSSSSLFRGKGTIRPSESISNISRVGMVFSTAWEMNGILLGSIPKIELTELYPRAASNVMNIASVDSCVTALLADVHSSPMTFGGRLHWYVA